MRIFGTPTGRFKFRQGFRGRMVIEIEYKWSGMTAHSRVVADHLDWRDATEADLRHPNLRQLIPKTEADVIVELLSKARDKAAPPPTINESEETCGLIGRLRKDEGSSVNILCDNPDFNGQPNCAVECCGHWTDWRARRFGGDTLLQALQAADAAMQAAPEPQNGMPSGHMFYAAYGVVWNRGCEVKLQDGSIERSMASVVCRDCEGETAEIIAELMNLGHAVKFHYRYNPTATA